MIFTTIDDMALSLRLTLNLNLSLGEIADLISEPHIRNLFDYGELISEGVWDEICKEVWCLATDDEPYPFDDF